MEKINGNSDKRWINANRKYFGVQGRIIRGI